MATIKLTAKEKKLLSELELGSGPETIKNTYSNESVLLEPQAVALHDYIKGCEVMNLHVDKQFALDLFRKLYPDEYSILLD